MSRLTSKERSALPAKTFAGPNRSFPINDANHARAALVDVDRAKGLTAEQKVAIRARAHAKLRGQS